MKVIQVKDILNLKDTRLMTGAENEILENFKKDTREINPRRCLCWNQRRKI